MKKFLFTYILFLTILLIFFLLGCSKKIVLYPNLKVDSKFIIPYTISGNPERFANESLLEKLMEVYDTAYFFSSTIKIPEIYILKNNTKKVSEKQIVFLVLKKGADLIFCSDHNFNGDYFDDSLIIRRNFFIDTTHLWLKQFDNHIVYNLNLSNDTFYNKPIELNIFIDIGKHKFYYENKSQISLTFSNVNSYGISTFFLNGRKYFAVADNSPSSKIWGLGKDNFYIVPTKQVKSTFHLDAAKALFQNDTIRIGGSDWRVDSFSILGEFIALRKIERRKIIFGYNENESIPNFEGFDIVKNTFISKKLLSGKDVTTLVFWAGWCSPCLKNISNYSLLSKDLERNNNNFIGIIWDSPSNLEFIKQDIATNNILWPNILSNIESISRKNIAQLLHVESIPLYIVFDEAGKIMYRGNDFNYLRNKLKYLNAIK